MLYFFKRQYLFLNIISSYLTILTEVCAKYQIACGKLEFCYQKSKFLICVDEGTFQFCMQDTTQGYISSD